jgi:transposase
MEVGAEVGEGSSGRRRYWTAEEKRRIVELTLSSSLSVASVSRQHGVNANQVFYWRKQYHAGQLGGERADESPSLCLLPVSVGNEEPAEAGAPETERETHESAEPPLTMNIEFPGGALVSLAGAVDAEIVRAVVESLRG